VIITLGVQAASGVYVKVIQLCIRPWHVLVKGVDATAAGDAFCGALAASLANGVPMVTALQKASAAGAVTATRKGAISSLPTAAEVEALLSAGR